MQYTFSMKNWLWIDIIHFTLLNSSEHLGNESLQPHAPTCNLPLPQRPTGYLLSTNMGPHPYEALLHPTPHPPLFQAPNIYTWPTNQFLDFFSNQPLTPYIYLAPLNTQTPPPKKTFQISTFPVNQC